MICVESWLDKARIGSYGAVMPTEVWIRNPKLCIRECKEVGVRDFAWDEGFLISRKMDLVKFMSLYYGSTAEWRALVIGGTAPLLDREHTMSKPIARFPVWEYGRPWDDLVRLVKEPVGLNERLCSTGPPMERPLFGQPHRVVITYTPIANSSAGKQFYHALAELQEDNPECVIHVHGSYSFRVAFGLGYQSADFEPRELARKGRIIMPNGQMIPYEEAGEYEEWFEIFGIKVADLETPRVRCIYNIRSAMWAGKYFMENVRFKHKDFSHLSGVDILSAKSPAKTRRIFFSQVHAQDGDKFLCNVCSLKSRCRYFRVGAICAVPDSEPQQLAELFGTRDSERIIDGLSSLLRVEAERFTEARQAETDKHEINPEVTKMLDKLFTHGRQLADLLTPKQAALPAGTQVTNNTLILTGTVAEQTTLVQRYLMEAGIPEAAITPDIVAAIIGAPGETLEEKAVNAGAVMRAIGP